MVVGFLFERRGLPTFLPFMTWERMMRLSDLDGPVPIAP